MGRAGDRVSSKQSPHGMSYGQGRRQGQQQTGPTGNELWAGPATGSAASRASREWAIGRAGDRVSIKQGQQGMSYGQGRRQGQQQTEPARYELWSWAGDRVSSKQGPQEMSYGQGPWQGQQQAGPAGRSATGRAGCGWAIGQDRQ